MAKKILSIVFLLVLAGVFCSAEKKETGVSIQLSYTLNFKNDSWENKRTGLLWALSYLGAELPRGSFDKAVHKTGKGRFALDLSQLGFGDEALNVLKIICDSIKNTPRYRRQGNTDIGHFIAVTLGSSWHYYRITGAPFTYNGFLSLHQADSFAVAALSRSSVSRGERRLLSKFSTDMHNAAFISEEGRDGAAAGSFVALEREVFDIMPNGQLRFMIYDEQGKLRVSADPSLSDAGKPAKCIWCHEINVQPLFEKAADLPGYVHPADFNQLVHSQNQALKNYREKLNTDIDFSRTQDHTQMELLYISYMEPSLQRLSKEWRLPVSHLKKMLAVYQPRPHHEFSFLGDLYARPLLPEPQHQQNSGYPGSIREERGKEPDYFPVPH